MLKVISAQQSKWISEKSLTHSFINKVRFEKMLPYLRGERLIISVFFVVYFWQSFCSMFSKKIWYKFVSCQEHFGNKRGDSGTLSALDVCGYFSFQRNHVVAKYPNSSLSSFIFVCLDNFYPAQLRYLRVL